jgi:hypothetical protein
MKSELKRGTGAGSGPAAAVAVAAAAPGSGSVIEPFIDKREVALRLNKRVRTVDNWMRAGILPYYKISQSVSFKWSEIETALRKHCRGAAIHN